MARITSVSYARSIAFPVRRYFYAGVCQRVGFYCYIFPIPLTCTLYLMNELSHIIGLKYFVLQTQKMGRKVFCYKVRHRFLARGFDWEGNIGYQLTSIINLFSVSESCVFAAKTTSVGNKRIPSLLICV